MGLNAEAFAGRRDAFVDKPDAFEIIMDGEWFEQLFAMAIADESHMLIAGKVDRDDQDALERRLGEKFPQLRTLILINGFSFRRRWTSQAAGAIRTAHWLTERRAPSPSALRSGRGFRDQAAACGVEVSRKSISESARARPSRARPASEI